jgi:peptidoglycan L-alanyl-D-glutamate endopeptidase CwlK
MMSCQCERPRTQGNLSEVHEDLQRVTARAIELCKERGIDFICTEGHRSVEQQRQYVATGKSQTMNSRHLGGLAIDVAFYKDGRCDYEFDDQKALWEVFKEAADELGVPIEWGGNWKHFKDTPHIQLAKEQYPDVLAI